MNYHNIVNDYREPTLKIIDELDSDNPEIETIESCATKIAMISNATHPKYAEDIFQNIQDGNSLDALNLSTSLDNNSAEIYEQARNNDIPNNRTRERTEEALENFEIESTLDSTQNGTKTLEATH